MKKQFLAILILLAISTTGCTSGQEVDEKQELPIKGMEGINIISDSISIRIVPSKKEKITAHLTGTVLGNSAKLETTSTSSSLNIIAKRVKRFYVLDDDSAFRLEISIPEKKYKEIKVHSGGDLEIDQKFQAEKLELLASGDITVNNFQGKELVVEGYGDNHNLSNINGNIIIKKTKGFVDIDNWSPVKGTSKINVSFGFVSIMTNKKLKSLDLDLKATEKVETTFPLDASQVVHGEKYLKGYVGKKTTDMPRLEMDVAGGIRLLKYPDSN
ncbi:DUF4097 family beta strand repeat-containing protein [Shimazuella kribbensis]|uniref:DUF4097 family beta strand repeat-containing protein n=1 Tax=Shimazuella kribbensis TaxID=139808 RepID=UPI0004289AA9|nr:DUF4097 family beta strand repeat-containing protein [Shimazuella kribbensis]